MGTKKTKDNLEGWNAEEYAKQMKEHLRGVRMNPLKKQFKDKEEHIFEIIRTSGIKGGISHNQLAFIVDLDRKTLRPYTKSLLKKGLVKKGDGLRGKYLPTEEPYKDPILNAYFFGDNFKLKMLKQEDLITTTKQQEYPTSVDYFKIYSCLFEPKFTATDRLECTLFEFSNRIGAFITYSLIQAMNPANNSSELSKRDQDEVVKKWVLQAISPILPFLVSQFKDSIYKGIDRYPFDYDDGLKYMERSPKFVLDKEIINQLLNAFGRLYPLVSQLFNEIMKDLPKLIDLYKRDMEFMYHKWERQKACQHDYNEPTMTLFGYYGKQCSKCYYIKKAKASAIKSARVGK